MELVVESPLVVDIERATSSVSLPANATRRLETSVSARVPDECDLGYYALRIDLRSSRGSLRTQLTASRDVGLFQICVNHRLYESEIETDGSPGAIARLHALCASTNASPPEEQMALFCGAVFASVARKAVLTDEKRQHIGDTFRGRLLDPDRMWEHYDELERDAAPAVSFACALHFFAALPVASREKIIDASFHAASRDGVLDAEEKGVISRMAERFGFDRDWLNNTLPRVLEAGDSKVVARRTNLLGGLAAIVLLIPVVMMVRAALGAIFGPHADERVSAAGPLFDFAVVAVAGVLALEPLRRALIRTACSSCASVEVDTVADSEDASMTGDGDAVRCVDCGARGSLDGGERSFRHGDCAPGRGSPLQRIATAALVGAAVAFIMHRVTPEVLRVQTNPSNVIAWLAMAAAYLAIVMLARRLRVAYLVTSAIAALGLMFLVIR